jgi:hypothetical protein
MTRPKNNQALLDHLAENPDGDLIGDILAQERAATQQANKDGQFWQRMWSKYPHLQDNVPFVNAILGREMERLKGMSLDAAIDEIARIVTLEKRAAARRVLEEEKYAVYRGGPGIEGAVPIPESGDHKETSISATIKRRKMARYNAQHTFNGNRRPSDPRKVAAE